MDGYAVRADDVAHCPVNLTRVGEAAAGHPWTDHVEPGQAVRIFTGGYVPNGANTIIIQENVDAPTEADHSVITVREGATQGPVYPASWVGYRSWGSCPCQRQFIVCPFYWAGDCRWCDKRGCI